MRSLEAGEIASFWSNRDGYIPNLIRITLYLFADPLMDECTTRPPPSFSSPSNQESGIMLKCSPISIVKLQIVPVTRIGAYADMHPRQFRTRGGICGAEYNLQRAPHRAQYQFRGPKAKCTSDSGGFWGVSVASASGLHNGISDALLSLDMLIAVRDNASWVERRLHDILCLCRQMSDSDQIR